MALTFLRWTCLVLMLTTGAVSPIGAFFFLCCWAAIGIYQIRTGLL